MILGVAADRIGRRAVLAPSLALFGLGGVACGLAEDFGALLWLRVLQKPGRRPWAPLNTAVIADMYAGARTGQGVGYNAGVLAMGTAAYPALGGVLAMFGAGPFPARRGHSPGPGGLAAAGHPGAAQPGQPGRLLPPGLVGLRRRRTAFLLILSLGTFFLLYGPFVTYFPVRLGDLFGAPAWLGIGVIVSVGSLFTGLAASRLGRLNARFGQERLAVAAYGYAASMLAFLVVPSAWLSLLPVILFGFGQGLAIPGLSHAPGRAPAEHRGAFMAASGSALRIGQDLGPFVAGLAFAAGGHSGPFWLGAAVAAGLALLAWRALTPPAR